MNIAITTRPHSRRSTRIRFGRLCAVAALGCAATVLPFAPTASASDLGNRPPPTYEESAAYVESTTVCPLYVWYINHNPTVDKPRGNQQERDGRTPPRQWCEPLPRA